MAVKGFDRYEYTPKIDYAQAKKEGYAFVIHKATEGATFHDPTFETEYKASQQAGLIPGAYCFARPKTSKALDEWNAYATAVSHVGGFVDGVLPPILDLEDTETGFTAAEMQAWVKQWLTLAKEKSGKTPILYSYAPFIEEYGLHTLSSLCHLWIAAYGTNTPSLGGFPSYSFWQYSDKGTVDGKTPIDLDEWGGTQAELEAFVGKKAESAPAPAQPAEKPAPEATSTTKTSGSTPSYGERTAVKVQAGQTLTQIATRYQVPVDVLARYNSLANPNLIFAGQWIRIPSAYTVKSGDTLSGKFGSEWQYVATLNNINPDKIWPGQVIYY